MPDPRPRLGPRPRGRRRIVAHLMLVASLGAAALLSFGVVSGLAADKSVETAGSIGSYHWSPNAAEVSAGGTVEFKNSQSIPHGVVFESAPATPSCSGNVPSVGTQNWAGTCTFSQPGTYKFYCPVHPTEMKGTITVTGSAGPSAPVVTTEPASPIKDTEATLNGKVNPSEQSTTYWFKWGTSTAYGHETAHESAEDGNVAIAESATLSGLTASTTYHFRLVAENLTGTTEGADRSFTTGGPPTATTEQATAIGGVEATLVGLVNPHGLSTTYRFKYGPTEAYGHETAEKPAGSGTTPVSKSEPLTGLLPETTYHFRVVAKNSADEVEGADTTFTTLGKPLATTGLVSGIGATAATLEGSVNPQGQATTYFFEFGPTEAYGEKTNEEAAGKGLAGVAASAPLSGLLPDTTYHYAVFAKNPSGTTQGADRTFVTGSTPPPPPPEEEKKPPPPPAEEVRPPDTKITAKPPATTSDRTPTIKFKSTVSGAAFRCSVDSKPFKTCRSPFTAPSLKPGKHKIRVQAVLGGVGDPTPASVSFKVAAKKK